MKNGFGCLSACGFLSVSGGQMPGGQSVLICLTVWRISRLLPWWPPVACGLEVQSLGEFPAGCRPAPHPPSSQPPSLTLVVSDVSPVFFELLPFSQSRSPHPHGQPEVPFCVSILCNPNPFSPFPSAFFSSSRPSFSPFFLPCISN